MAFVDLSRDLFENVTITLTPTVTYSSGSSGIISGSAELLPVKSKKLKEIRVMEFPGASAIVADASNISPGFDEIDAFKINSLPNIAQQINAGNPQAIANLKSALERYMVAVNVSPLDVRFSKNLPIERIEQPAAFASASIKKRNIKNVLMPYYRTEYDDCGFYYRNYHTLNFFTGNNFSTGSVLIYPNYNSSGVIKRYVSAASQFTLQFWINPRYKNEKNKEFHAGTIFQIPKALAVSLISGSQKDENGLVKSYKILGQFRNDVLKTPDAVDFNTDQFYVTSSVELKHNHWHHITIRWSRINDGRVGDLIVDGNKTTFSIDNNHYFADGTNLYTEMQGICIGNFYKGDSADPLGKFNNNFTAARFGTLHLPGEGSDTINTEPAESTYSFSNPLNAEVHEIKFYNKYLNDNIEIPGSGSGVTMDDVNKHKLSFYLPPYFYPESSERDVLFSPRFTVNTSSYTPTNNLFSFANNGKEINLENFTLEMIQKIQPRHFKLTASLENKINTIDQFMFENKDGNAKRNLTILPNDNGLFRPSYDIIKNHVTGTKLSEHYTGEAYNNTPENYDLIKLENALGALADDVSNKLNLFTGNSITNEVFGGSGDSTSYAASAIEQIKSNFQGDATSGAVFLATYNELKEDSSNYVAIFNISNLYYGNQIKPGSFQITDSSLTGSSGKIGITLKDNSRGGVYRADCLTKQADWNCVGNLFYDEGLLIIKSPHLSLYGKDHFETSFKGEQNVHSLVINVPAPRGFFDKSVNPSFVSLPKSENLNDEDTESIVITSVNIHDENFNIIMRANLAQPIIKDKSDEFVIRLKMDF